MKSDPELCAMLAACPLFRGLNTTERRQMLDIAQPVSFAAGQTIVAQGESGQCLWVLRDGQCEVTSRAENGPVSLATIEPCEHFGEMSFFSAAPHSASVRAKTAVELLRINRADYDELIEDGALGAYKVAYNCVGALAEHLRHMDGWVTNLVGREESRENPEWDQLRRKLFNGWKL